MGFCPQHNVLWDELTCYEHLEFFGRSSERTPQEMCKFDIAAVAVGALLSILLCSSSNECVPMDTSMNRLPCQIGWNVVLHFLPCAWMRIGGMTIDALKQRGTELLRSVALLDKMHARASTLSGGCVRMLSVRYTVSLVCVCARVRVSSLCADGLEKWCTDTEA
eukprot:5864132-Amphidinium_carterae.1